MFSPKTTRNQLKDKEQVFIASAKDDVGFGKIEIFCFVFIKIENERRCLFCVFFYLSYISCSEQGKANEPARFCFLCVFGRGRLPLSLEDRERGFFFSKNIQEQRLCLDRIFRERTGKRREKDLSPTKMCTVFCLPPSIASKNNDDDGR